MLRVESSLFVLLELCSGLEICVRDDHGPEFELAVVQQTIKRQEMQDVVTKTTNTAFFDRNENRVFVGQLAYEIDV
jgi:hypothetical protein